jgi:hypothetical protein
MALSGSLGRKIGTGAPADMPAGGRRRLTVRDEISAAEKNANGGIRKNRESTDAPTGISAKDRLPHRYVERRF